MSKVKSNTVLLQGFIKLVLPILVIGIFTVIYIAHIEYRANVDQYLLVEENVLFQNRNQLLNTIKNAYSDIQILSESPYIKNYYNSPFTYQSSIKTSFQSFVNNKYYYQQIRLLDTLGLELIRTEYSNGKVVQVRDDLLQNKSERNYFLSLQQLSGHDFFISELDLNFENGQIEKPYRPMLRFGKVIYDSMSHNKIYLLFNYEANHLLNNIRNSKTHKECTNYFLNEQGYFIIGPDISYEWRFLYADSLQGKFMNLYANEWFQLKQWKGKTGHIISKNGYFTFLKVNLCEEVDNKESLLSGIYPLKPCKSYYLINYINLSAAQQLLVYPLVKKYGLLLIFFVILLITSTYVYFSSRQKQILEHRLNLLNFKFLTALIETLPNPIYFIDHINLSFGCNKAFEILMGKSREELSKMRIETFFGGTPTTIDSNIEGKPTLKITETRLKYPDGSIHHLIYYKAQIFDNGQLAGRLGVFTDITDIRKTEEALKESETKFRQMNKTKDRFFSIIAHDLKNPFHAIMGMSHLLKFNFNSISNEDKLNIVDNIHLSTDNTFQLLVNLLDWARVQEGKLKVEKQKTNLLKLVNQCIELLQPKILEKQLVVNVNIGQNVYILADPNMLSTVFRNLLTNAIKFTDFPGTITINAIEMAKFIEVSIVDTGSGINEEDLKNIFKIDKKTTLINSGHEQGTGLGLILCKDFIELNDGKIWVESEVSKGSVFNFTIPLYVNNPYPYDPVI